jgi:hypothetical protein
MRTKTTRNQARYCAVDDEEILFVVINKHTHQDFEEGVWVCSGIVMNLGNILGKNHKKRRDK